MTTLRAVIAEMTAAGIGIIAVTVMMTTAIAAQTVILEFPTAAAIRATLIWAPPGSQVESSHANNCFVTAA